VSAGARPKAGGSSAANSRIVKFGVGAVLVMGIMRFTVLAPDGDAAGDRGLAPAEEATDADVVVGETIAPVEPTRNPFAPVNGG
jgi:hypothetical protein